MSRPADSLHPKSLRGLERRLHERLFGRLATRNAPRYGSDAEATAALMDRLESQGLLVRPAAQGLTIEDLTLRTSYYYGSGSLAKDGGAPGALLVRSALFALSTRGALHAARAPRQGRPRLRRRGTARIRRAA
jgi:hypothetical protein